MNCLARRICEWREQICGPIVVNTVGCDGTEPCRRSGTPFLRWKKCEIMAFFASICNACNTATIGHSGHHYAEDTLVIQYLKETISWVQCKKWWNKFSYLKLPAHHDSLQIWTNSIFYKMLKFLHYDMLCMKKNLQVLYWSCWPCLRRICSW